MAFNKSKVLESALKSLNQGRITQAISEYQQILRHDAKDQVTLMTLGDLFARQGDMKRAIAYFEQLAQVYLGDGFYSKAIAIYKKIVKLAPSEIEPLERLANLYVQQGVLSEARPLFLQIVESHLKANRAPKAVEVLRRFLEVEPDNLRIQTRLAELYNVIGQKKEAAQTYLNFARQLYERGDLSESQKLADRALEVDPGNAGAIRLKAEALGIGERAAEAMTLLESLPEAEAGGEITGLLVDLALRSGRVSRAIEMARKEFARGPERFEMCYRVATSLIEGGQPEEALALLTEIRDAMIEAGEQDRVTQAFGSAADRMAGRIEPLEALVDICRRTSDSFRLPDAIRRLAQALETAGKFERAQALYKELLARDPDNENLLQKLSQLRASMGRTKASPELTPEEFVAKPMVESPQVTVSAPASEPPLDEDTQRYVAQALTDVDLFSSYGLAHKAVPLLEKVRERAPRHVPVLERLLDLYLGAGDEKRTADLAAVLERTFFERGDHANAERYAELRRRFQRVAERIAEQPAAVEPPAEGETSSAPPIERAEFPLPETREEATSPGHPTAPASGPPPVPLLQQSGPARSEQEIDLSAEWEALSTEAEESGPPAQALAPPETPIEPTAAEAAPPLGLVPPEAAPTEPPAVAETLGAEPTEPEAAQAGEFELELISSASSAEKGQSSGMTTEQLLSELEAEVEGFEARSATLEAAEAEEQAPAGVPIELPRAADSLPELHPSPEVEAQPAAPPVASESADGLEQIFQEFRAELGEMSDENEDLETHYNLGIAYREMGLLDEAIGEFQKVANAIRKGRPFRYAMQNSTLLGLSFMEKGEPKIAALWYARTLQTPGLDQETVLALRYDLGLAQELSGDAAAALDSFQQVYAMNIDYRDVADRIAALQKR